MPRPRRSAPRPTQPGAPPRGRPRDPALDEAILRATLDQMAMRGYSGFSVDDVAAAAGTTKPTIYLRYPSKAELATAALSHLREQEPHPASGEPRADLVAELGNFRKNLHRPHGLAMLGTLLAEEEHLPELMAAFRERVVRPRRAALLAHLEAGRARGLVREDADLEACVNLLVGSFYAHYLARGKVPEDWPERVVATVWDGLRPAAPPGRRARSPSP